MAKIHAAPNLVYCNRLWTISRTAPNPFASDPCTSVWHTRGSMRPLARSNGAAHGGRPSYLLSVERQGAVTPTNGARRARQLSPARRVAISSRVVPSILVANRDSCAVSSRFEGGRERRVTCDTFGASGPCSAVFKCAHCSTDIAWRNFQVVASTLTYLHRPVACGGLQVSSYSLSLEPA